MTGFEIAIISLAATATGLQAYSQYKQGKVAEQQARAEAAWHDYNAKMAKREEEAERQATIRETQQHARQSKELLARQRVLAGASGITMMGSPLLVAEDTAAQLVLERGWMREAGARRAARWRSRSILDITKAGVARGAAAGYRRAGTLSAGTTLLSGAADVGLMGYKMGVGKKKLPKATAWQKKMATGANAWLEGF